MHISHATKSPLLFISFEVRWIQQSKDKTDIFGHCPARRPLRQPFLSGLTVGVHEYMLMKSMELE
jgi:hypothetical protein